MSAEPRQRSNLPWRALAESAGGMEAWLGPEGRLNWVNPTLENITGFSLEECCSASDPAALLAHEDDRDFVRRSFCQILDGEVTDGVEMRWRSRSGLVLWLSLKSAPLLLDDGTPSGARLSLRDIRDRRQADMRVLEMQGEQRRSQILQMVYLQRREEERKRLEALLDVMDTGVLFLDAEHRVIHCNQAAIRMMGLAAEQALIGARAEVILDRWREIVTEPATFESYFESMQCNPHARGEREFELKDGRIVLERTAPVPGREPDSPTGRVWLHEDVTEQRRAARRLMELADRDPLTQLLNRRRFEEEITRMLADADRRSTPLGLLAIDLDDFKRINDRFGHLAGDAVLTVLAEAVGSTVRRNEIFFRVGGDEFAILAPDSGHDDMVGLARRVSNTIAEQRWTFGETPVTISASLGIAIYPLDARDGEQLISHADVAMYRAKARGRSAWQVFEAPTPEK